MLRIRAALTLALVCLAALVSRPAADNTTQLLPFAQNWSNTGLIATTNDWSAVPGIVGYRGDAMTGATAVDPQTVLADGSATPVNVNANQTNPNTFTTGGVAEFHLADPVVALQGSGTARAPHIVISVSTLGLSNVTVAYNLRDVDGSADNAVQPVALQFRVGASGAYTNVPAGFVADATSGPSLATLVTPVSAVLPAAASDQPVVQIRILTTDAAGSDEWVGIDDISITGGEIAGPTNPSGTGAASPSSVVSGNNSLLTVAVTPGDNPPSTELTVTADLTSIGGASSQPFFDDGSHGDATAGDLVFSYLAAATGTSGAKILSVSIADAQLRTATATIALTINEPPPTLRDVVISQVYGGGGGSTGIYANDYVELHNRESVAVSVGGWSVQYGAAGGSTWQVAALAGTIPAGGYYLIQLGTAGAGAPLWMPDAIGSANMSATAGKVALVLGTSALVGSCPAGSTVDLVGYGTTPNCFEGSGRAPAPSTTTAVFRNGDGNVDTNDNASDFFVGAPDPRTTHGVPPRGTGLATPNVVLAGDSTLLTVSVTAGRLPASTAITVTGNLTSIGGATSVPFVDDGTNGDLTAGDLVFSLAAAVSATTPPGSLSVPVTVADNPAGTPRATTTSISLAVPAPPTAIHDIQGSGTSSPFAGMVVSTAGIVTGLKPNGFFLQAADADADADQATSEGVFVFTTTMPVVSVGDKVLVTGTATEFFDLTEISSPGGSFTILASGRPLPTPVALTTDILNPAGTASQLENLEGMRVHADALVSVAPTNGFGEIETVLGGVARPRRAPGIAQSLPVPPDPLSGFIDCCIPRWDEDPERLMIDSDALAGMAVVSVTSNVTFTNVTGPLDFTFSRYKLAPEAPLVPASALMSAVPVPAPAANEFTVAGYNIENFVNGATQRRKAALAIRDVMRLPDVIGTIEILDLASLQALAAEVNTLATEAGGANPLYEAHLIPASPTATQNVGFLVKTSRVQVNAVTQERATETFVNPGDGLTYLLHDRPPLVLRATIDPYGVTPEHVIVLVNHPRSFIDIELVGGDGIRVREKRTKQAESIAGLLQELQTANPTTPIVSVGDYNAYEFNDGYTDPVSVIKGTPTPGNQIVVAGSPDLVNPDFVNLTETLPADERYSFVFDGVAQAIDHVFVNTVARSILQRYAVARNNADFPETAAFVNDITRPERNSDHDMPVAYFAFPGTPVVVLNGSPTMTVEAYGDPFVDPGATAHDDTGPLPVTVTGSVDVDTPGEYTLSYSASNLFHTTTVTRTVKVVDTTAPAIADFALTPNLLWPPNHKMVDVAASYTASDGSQSVTCSLDVTSSEAQNGLGDGDTDVDWQVFSSTMLQLRAERSGRSAGRVYTVALACVDAAGNRTVQTLPVTVPRNR